MNDPRTARLRHAFGLAVLSFLIGLSGPARADDPSADEIAGGLNPTIAEVTSTGAWEADGRKGIYRAIVVLSGTPDRRVARAYIQWIAPRVDGQGFEAIATKPIQPFNDRNADNAELTMDSEKTSEGTLLVQSYDPAKDTDQSVTVKLGLPGQLTYEEPGPSE